MSVASIIFCGVLWIITGIACELILIQDKPKLNVWDIIGIIMVGSILGPINFLRIRPED